MILQPEVRENDLPAIKWLIDKGDGQAAGQALRDFMADYPEDPGGLFLLGRLLLESDNPGFARVVYESLANTHPRAETYHNLGKAWDHLNRPEKAEACFREALQRDPKNIEMLLSLGTNMVQQYRSEEAIKLAEQALEVDPTRDKARSNLGFAYLQMREFGKGWDCYEFSVGKIRHRAKKVYTGEPYWDGAKGKRLIVYGEQGVGDQIAGLEPLRDCMRENTVVAVDCTPKLVNLFQRSYPDVEIYGDVHKRTQDWHGRLEVDASCAMFTLHRHYRRSEDDYPKTPYLVADPARRLQWRALLDSLGPEPKVGIAWSGGVSLTQRTERHVALDKLLPILQQNCHWVNLEYRDRSEEIADFERRRGITVHDWPWALRTDDYDDTAALVAELDLVITVASSVVHLSGALGVPCYCIVHERPNVHYSREGDQMAYYGSVRMYRRGGEWSKAVLRVANDLKDWVAAREVA